MCGRFAFIPNELMLREQYDITLPEPLPIWYNIAPTATILFIGHDGTQYYPLYARWGLLPFWTKDVKKSALLTNARAETVWTKPAFRSAAKSRRGIVLMSGFYEWRTEQEIKQPYYFTSNSQQYLSIAALWETCDINNQAYLFVYPDNNQS